MFPIEQHTIFVTLAGSQAHGTARGGSDVDLRGVCVAPPSVRLSLFRAFEQYEGGLPDGLVETVFPRVMSRIQDIPRSQGHPAASGAFDATGLRCGESRRANAATSPHAAGPAEAAPTPSTEVWPSRDGDPRAPAVSGSVGGADTELDGPKVECVIFDVAKFLRLCAAANPNALEILFADESDWVLQTPVWRALYEERQGFLTKKVQHTYLGYAMAQLKKIRTHRAWLASPPTKKPSREDFGLPIAGGTLSRDDQNRLEANIAAKIRSYGIDDFDLPKATRIAMQERIDAFLRDVLSASGDELTERTRAIAGHGLGVPPDVMSALGAEKKYRAAVKHWEAYQAWKSHRNRARAELERRYGYDTKHAMHLVRLMRMGLEALETGELHVRRDDADELLAIRDGAMSFEELLALVDSLRARIEAAARTTSLPADVDADHVDAILRRCVGSG